MDARLEAIRDTVLARNPGEAEFHQAVTEVFESLGELSEGDMDEGKACRQRRRSLATFTELP